MTHFDYIITGGGCAGLSLIHQLLDSPLKEKKILLIDREEKKQNDRTWCFWETTNGPFEEIVFRKWDQLSFHSNDLHRFFNIAPFQYKMIRGIDFYNHVHKRMASFPSITILREEVENITNEEGAVQVRAGGQTYTADWCFNSILFQPIDKNNTNYLDQHFKGWVIKTDRPTFNPSEATLMDFRIKQEGETRFLYVLPFDEHQALVEVAIFSNHLLNAEDYDRILHLYIKEYLTPDSYTVLHQEYGVIPMTDFPFSRIDGSVLHLGTAGGDTKASTGYTFWRIQQYVGRLVKQLTEKGHPLLKEGILDRRFKIYDSIMLKVLAENRLAGDEFFTYLFKKNPPQILLRFLNEDSSFIEELLLMRTLPTFIFLKAFFKELQKKHLKIVPNLPV